jgi:alkanesulfonate monooxygenase SsuD/methylene tetrahydromethanopterin reductase-like flavin-dependent oxidoreductase (luciferase family)
MRLGLFSMPLHRPEKPYSQALAEDREMVLLADNLGYAEAWIGEHFTSKVEQIPSAMMFFATLINETTQIKFGTGVVNMPHHHPGVVAAEAAMFDQLSGGRLMLGVGPGGLFSDAEFFGEEDMGKRNRVALEYVNLVQKLWNTDEVFELECNGETFTNARSHWPRHGLGVLPKPMQQPHPPFAMAMVSARSGAASVCAERDFLPISANFIGEDDVIQQWQTYAETRQKLGKPADPDVWRLSRNILVTETDAEAQDVIADPDGDFAFYFRYLRSMRSMAELSDMRQESIEQLNTRLDIAEAIETCVIAGNADTVLARLVDLADRSGPFGTLLMAAMDWEPTGRWQSSMQRLATDVAPKLSQHLNSLSLAAEAAE